MLARIISLLGALALATPAHAAEGSANHNSAELGLFALGVAALMIGHFGARRQPPR